MTDDKNQNDIDESLHEKLKDLKSQEGILGYILRGSNSAAIDLNDPTKIIDYAVLSSAVLDVSFSMTENLPVGEIETVVVETENTKLLSMNVGEKRLSIFMEKNVDHNRLLNEMK